MTNWNIDDLVKLAYDNDDMQVGEDNDGQIILYTGLVEKNGFLVPMPPEDGE